MQYGILILAEIAIVAVFFVTGARTSLLRDADPNQPDFRARTFSLSKSQLAFWSVIVLGSFVYVYFTQGKFLEVLNNTALILLGLSTATSALSAVAGGAPPAAGVAPEQAHKSFLADILSDGSGMNIHRLQMAMWTVVFGIIFINEVIEVGNFPTYDKQVYALMGISSATYVWFKKSET